MEARDIPYPMVIAICPTKEFARHLLVNNPDIVLDYITFPFTIAAKIREPLLAKKEAYDIGKSPCAALKTLRQPWTFCATSTDRNQKTSRHFYDNVQLLTRLPRKEYWLLAEKTYHLLAESNLDEAQKCCENLVKLYPMSLDPHIITAKVYAKSSSPDEAGKWIYEKAINHPRCNVEKAWQIGKILFQWKCLQQLEDLLIQWNQRSDWFKNHNLAYLTSRFYRLNKDKKNELSYLCRAVAGEPLRADYLMALGNYFRENNDVNNAIQSWEHAGRNFACDPVASQIKIILALESKGQKTEIVRRLDLLSKTHPEDTEVDVIRQRFYDNAS